MTKKIVFNFQEEQSNLLVHKKKKKRELSSFFNAMTKIPHEKYHNNTTVPKA
jgi:hypothetical protein